MGVDLTDFYPSPGTASTSLRSDGAPANPGAGGGMTPSGTKSLNVSSSFSLGGSPAIAMLAVVALSLFLLHLE